MRLRERSPAGLMLLGVGLLLQGCGSRDKVSAAEAHRQFQQAVDLVRSGGDVRKVNETVLTLRSTPGFEKHAQLLSAGLLLQGSEHVRALRQLQQLRPDGELVAPARLWTAEALYRTGLLADARECISPLVDNPDYAADAHRWLAALEYDLGANTRSLAHLQELVRLKPDDYRPRALAAQMYLDFGQFEAARQHFTSALDRSPPPLEHQQLSVGLARTLLELRDYTAALEALAQAAPDATVLALQSTCHQQLAQPDQARATLEDAMRLDPDNLHVLSQQADLMLADGRPEDAIVSLKTLIQANPSDHKARYRLSLAYRQAGQSREADAEMAKATTLREQYDRVSELNNRAVAAPDDAAVRRELAQLWRQLGRPELADVWERAAAAIEQSRRPSDPDGRKSDR